LLLSRATDLTAYPIDALYSKPFIVDDLSSAFGNVLARHQAPASPSAMHRSLVSLRGSPAHFALAVVVRSAR
jgi:hypothetical protein